VQVPGSRAANRDHNGAKQENASTAPHIHLLGRPPYLTEPVILFYLTPAQMYANPRDTQVSLS
jgi:hypothetical protein